MSSALAGRLRPSIAALSRRAVPTPHLFVPARSVPSLLAVRSMATSFKKDFQEFIFIIPDKPGSLEKRKQVRPYVALSFRAGFRGRVPQHILMG
jgi:hypothetical protein